MNGFTIYREYYELITLLPEKEQQELLLAITKFMFNDIEPVLNDRQTKIFNNLRRPLEKSKKRGRCGSIIKSNENQNGIKSKSNENQNQIEKETHQDVNVIVNVNDNVNVNVNNLENNKGVIGEKEETFISQVKKIIDYLNVKTKSNFRYTSQKTQSKISARLNEGYTLNDFIVVIDKKTDEWLEDPEFCKYLCPETLFGTKFEKYLNQKTTTKQKTKSDEQWEILKGVYNGTIKID